MKNTPETTFWTKGQSFLFFAPENTWPEIFNDARVTFNASPFEIIEVGANGTLSIEEARFIQIESVKPPTQSAIRLCLIYHIDKASLEATNALLKVIEEPAPQTRFVLFATTTRVLDTVRSRCIQKYLYEQNNPLPELLLPLEKDTDFATVSLRIAQIVSEGNALILIDQWTRELLQSHDKTDALHWLVEIRQAISQSSVNATALLEVTYLYITHELTLPNNIEKYIYEKHGHI